MKKAKVSFSYDPELFKDTELFEEYLSLFEEEGIHVEYIDYMESEYARRGKLILNNEEKIDVITVSPFTEETKALEMINKLMEQSKLTKNFSLAEKESVKIEWVADTKEKNVFRLVHPEIDVISYPLLVYRLTDSKEQ